MFKQSSCTFALNWCHFVNAGTNIFQGASTFFNYLFYYLKRLLTNLLAFTFVCKNKTALEKEFAKASIKNKNEKNSTMDFL